MLIILKFLKTVLESVTIYLSSTTCFVYIAPANKLQTQVRGILHLLRNTLCQINEEILKALKKIVIAVQKPSD